MDAAASPPAQSLHLGHKGFGVVLPAPRSQNPAARPGQVRGSRAQERPRHGALPERGPPRGLRSRLRIRARANSLEVQPPSKLNPRPPGRYPKGCGGGGKDEVSGDRSPPAGERPSRSGSGAQDPEELGAALLCLRIPQNCSSPAKSDGGPGGPGAQLQVSPARLAPRTRTSPVPASPGPGAKPPPKLALSALPPRRPYRTRSPRSPRRVQLSPTDGSPPSTPKTVGAEERAHLAVAPNAERPASTPPGTGFGTSPLPPPPPPRPPGPGHAHQRPAGLREVPGPARAVPTCSPPHRLLRTPAGSPGSPSVAA
ncbi:uncharacterized protein [Desmodus rotundus]|uniref:uncharacterized protein n=1 Tax=Desmodus rotundus TaxID=9430 RepID=UPI0039E282E2